MRKIKFLGHVDGPAEMAFGSHGNCSHTTEMRRAGELYRFRHELLRDHLATSITANKNEHVLAGQLHRPNMAGHLAWRRIMFRPNIGGVETAELDSQPGRRTDAPIRREESMRKGPRPPGWSGTDAACFNAEGGCFAAGTFIIGLIVSGIAGFIFAAAGGPGAGIGVFVLGMIITILVTWLSWHTSPKVK
ncbi:hypothetical protein [Glycomyces salinus]|uniref:hypothetical protein n=1 Tax=Glycomyces salinus TaxID=980294 RepID=UPI0018EB0239|nr:hypothetical protein [Glycomyces salinus]